MLQNRRQEALAVAVLSAATIFFFLPMFHNLAQQYTDFGAHLEFVRSLLRTGSTDLPHFVFEIGVASIYRLGFTLEASSTILMVLAMLATGLVLFWIFRRETQPWVAMGLSLCLLVVGPLSLVTLPSQELYLGYMTPNSYHNPTLILLKPTALGLMLVGLRSLDPGVVAPRWGLILAGALLSLLSCLTKPSFQICFLPGLGVLTALAILRREDVDLRLSVFGLALPSFAVLGWQYLISFDGKSAVEIIVAPLQVIRGLDQQILLKLMLSLSFPAVFSTIFFREASRDRLMQIAWATLAFGLSYGYLLAETGRRFQHGNFLWSGYIAVFVLYVACIPLLLRQEDSPGRRLCWALFALHVVSGFIFAVTQMLGERYLEWW